MNLIKFKKNMTSFIKWCISIILLITIIVYNIIYQKIHLFIRLILSFFILILISFIILSTNKGQNLLSFIYDARIETYKVVWPSYKETWYTTLIIIFIVTILSCMLYILDNFLIYIISYLTGTRS
ncbi:preprotein translocase subunit SecE [Enterobacteriaceae endosymbiont of Donacia cincticornis]|uniref:preprotein translocase subunit SecE n=1 Tax=Enterobacteriaceae endosymbiont of Donacia cincticornis TaxID=2675773 RepID=UPI001448E0D1|nr:preprotein translocase subunit SecE [Enterobacteriaceae endosymbiont of Donacia cincticornis]QJC36198.1 preprotein translocase subunit SecE [Enterobacteriaceae endosymbiont of Donacia cincticornis]